MTNGSEIQPETRTIQCIACLVLHHLQGECGDGDACVTLSDRSQSEALRDEILRQCSWLKDCTSESTEYPALHLSDRCNENVWITWDSKFDSTLPKWVGLRVRWGHWS